MFLINPYILQASGNPLWNDLLAYYTADNTPNDALGTYNGTLVNGTTYGTGIISNGFSFDGVNDYVDLGNNFDFTFGTPFSISLWYYPTSVTGYKALFAKQDTAAPAYKGYQLQMENANIRLWMSSDYSVSDYLIKRRSTFLSINTWYHLTVTYDGAKDTNGVKIYINGADGTYDVNINTLSNNITNPTINATISSQNGAASFASGLIDEVGIWNRELSASEVTELYNAGAAKQYPTGINVLWSDLLAYYTADNTPNDALGTYNGTLVNGATYGTGIINQGFSFDGVNDYVDMGNVLDFDGSTPFSISLWFNASLITNFRILISKINNASPFTGYSFQIISGQLRFFLCSTISPSNYIDVRTVNTYSASTMYHAVLTYDGSKNASGIKIYVDSSSETLSTSTNTLTGSTSNSFPMNIGVNNLISNYFSGIIDEISIFNKELSASEVTELYNAGAGKQYPN